MRQWSKTVLLYVIKLLSSLNHSIRNLCRYQKCVATICFLYILLFWSKKRQFLHCRVKQKNDLIFAKALLSYYNVIPILRLPNSKIGNELRPFLSMTTGLLRLPKLRTTGWDNSDIWQRFRLDRWDKERMDETTD